MNCSIHSNGLLHSTQLTPWCLIGTMVHMKSWSLRCDTWNHDWVTPTTPGQHAILAAVQADRMKGHGPVGSHDGSHDGSRTGWAPAGTPAVKFEVATDAVPTMDELLAACGAELKRRREAAK